NAIYIRNTRTDDLVERLKPFLDEPAYQNEMQNPEWFRKAVELVKTDLTTLADLKNHISIFFDSQYRISAEAKDLLDKEPARKVVEAFASYLEKQDAGNQNLYAEAVRFAREATGAKGRALFMPVRAALTGLLHGPELDKIFDVLGRNAALRRLKYFER
ncbi:MAG: hypothetical protein GYA70_07375, partial [Deltaproteobacteria bacterium]|nr:hypothetical protein [Deltaproteobacteria bacterium]